MASETMSKPVFDNKKVTVIFVLGGPGAGKGTQCKRLVEDFDFCHLSGIFSHHVLIDLGAHIGLPAGDLLRAEQNREGSQYGKLIQTCIKNGTIVPMHVTIKLLENAMKQATEEYRPGEGWQNGSARFLIDGFPRKMDQALEFDNTVCLSSVVLFFDTTEEVMLKRLLERGQTSGREDDNTEIIKKRFVTYKSDTMPVIEHYSQLGKVALVDSTGAVEEVHKTASAVVRDALAGKYLRS